MMVGVIALGVVASNSSASIMLGVSGQPSQFGSPITNSFQGDGSTVAPTLLVQSGFTINDRVGYSAEAAPGYVWASSSAFDTGLIGVNRSNSTIEGTVEFVRNDALLDLFGGSDELELRMEFDVNALISVPNNPGVFRQAFTGAGVSLRVASEIIAEDGGGIGAQNTSNSFNFGGDGVMSDFGGLGQSAFEGETFGGSRIVSLPMVISLSEADGLSVTYRAQVNSSSQGDPIVAGSLVGTVSNIEQATQRIMPADLALTAVSSPAYITLPDGTPVASLGVEFDVCGAPVPEPTSLLLVGAGLMTLILKKRDSRKG